MENSQEDATNNSNMLKNMRQSIAFDIDTNVGNELLGDYRKAHYTIQQFLEREKGFFHPQGSVYESPIPMTYAEARVILEDLLNKYPFLCKCIRDLRVTSILERYICNDMLQYDGTAQMHNNEEQTQNQYQEDFEQFEQQDFGEEDWEQSNPQDFDDELEL